MGLILTTIGNPSRIRKHYANQMIELLCSPQQTLSSNTILINISCVNHWHRSDNISNVKSILFANHVPSTFSLFSSPLPFLSFLIAFIKRSICIMSCFINIFLLSCSSLSLRIKHVSKIITFIFKIEIQAINLSKRRNTFLSHHLIFGSCIIISVYVIICRIVCL